MEGLRKETGVVVQHVVVVVVLDLVERCLVAAAGQLRVVDCYFLLSSYLPLFSLELGPIENQFLQQRVVVVNVCL